MEKKEYMTPELEAVKLQSATAFLALSDNSPKPDPSDGEDGPGGVEVW